MSSFDIERNTIFIDMDGVLADFYGYVDEITGINSRKPSKNEKELIWCLLESSHFFLKLKPLPNSDTILATAINTGADVQLLSAKPYRAKCPTASSDKKKWFKRFFPRYNSININISPTSWDKIVWCRPGDILIDDLEENIKRWRNTGGIGILHTSVEETNAELLSLIKVKNERKDL